MQLIGVRVLICTKSVCDHHGWHPDLGECQQQNPSRCQISQRKIFFYKSSRLNLMYICAIGFVHHSDQSIHLILISVLILPACFLWVVVGLPDQKLMK